MITYTEIKDFVLNFNLMCISDEDTKKLKEIMAQLNFTWEECGCKALAPKLYHKLEDWLKTHDALSHYAMSRGVVIYTPSGKMVTAVNITDELAEEALTNPDNEKYIKLIYPKEEQEQQITTDEVTQLEKKMEAKKRAVSGKRIIKNKSK